MNKKLTKGEIKQKITDLIKDKLFVLGKKDILETLERLNIDINTEISKDDLIAHINNKISKKKTTIYYELYKDHKKYFGIGPSTVEDLLNISKYERLKLQKHNRLPINYYFECKMRRNYVDVPMYDIEFMLSKIGTEYVVKSLTAYGAFVDLGGVDGMVHITELSWKHIKHPSDVVKIGDSIEVFVKALDVEKKRISLGYKTEETNPWNIFKSKYAVEDIAEVKIVNLMPFGAFAEIVPGVDGLIHISQICEQKIQKPADVLSVGETVSAKITAIDEENKKVSLSIKALLVPEVAAEETPATEEEAAADAE